MTIGIASPMTLKTLNVDFGSSEVPVGYDFPMISWLVNALKKQGHQVVAYTTSTGIDRPLVYEGKDLTICIAPSRDRHRARDLFRRERRELLELMRAYPVEVINAHWSYEFAWAALDSGIPTLVTLQDHAWSILKYQFDAYRLMRLVMNYVVIHRAKFISTDSFYLYGLLGNRNKKKARVIPNFYSREVASEASSQSAKGKYIISVCNGFGRRKNVGTALQAFSLLRKKIPGLEYHLVGSGMEYGGPAYRFAIESGLTNGVIFRGSLSNKDVISEVKKALVLVHPAKEESFGVSVLEGMVLGTPVVGGRFSGNVPFLLNGGKAGMLCDVNSAEDIAQAVLRILADEELSRSLVRNAREFARNHFSEDIVVPAYIDYYQHILSGNQICDRRPEKKTK